MLVHIQIHLVGRYLHLETLTRSKQSDNGAAPRTAAAAAAGGAATNGDAAAPSHAPFNEAVQSLYFAYTKHLIERGLAIFIVKASAAAEEALQSRSLTERCTRQTLTHIFGQLRRSLRAHGGVSDLLHSCLLPPETVLDASDTLQGGSGGDGGEDDENREDEVKLKLLLDETR